MKRIIISILTFLTISTSVNAQDASFDWAKSMGGSNNEVGRSITTDGSGNVYTTGSFEGTVDFDPGVGVANLISTGGTDFFIQKLDASGNFIWAKSMGASGAEIGFSIITDLSANIYISGSFSGTVDFDPGMGTSNLVSEGGSDIFIQKLDASGDLIWVKSMGGSGNDYGRSITLDALGNVCSTGSFQSTVDFDPGAGVDNLVSAGSNDVFIQKLDASGDFIWAKAIRGSSNNIGSSIATDLSGNVYTAGSLIGTADFDPGVGVHNLASAGNNDIFIQKLDASGDFVWAKRMGSWHLDAATAIKVDGLGNIYTTGYYGFTVDFDPGVGINELESTGFSPYDIFIQKLDASGDFVWAKSMGSSYDDLAYSIALDAEGNIYSTGRFHGTADFDPGVGVENLVSGGSNDIYILKLDPSGNYVWAKSMGGVGSGSDIGYSLTVDGSNNVYTTGLYRYTVDFDPGAGVSNLTTVGNDDMFIQKLKQCAPPSGTDIQIACDSYTWIDGITYTESEDIATHTLTNEAGCDSVVTLDLTINYANTGTDVQTACDSYTWINGITYTVSNDIAIYGLTNEAGCDSIVTLDLTIIYSNTGTDTQTACETYTWIDGITYTVSNNIATYTLTNAEGCDSLVTLDLTISAIDVSTTSTPTTIWANNESATSYQWIDCVDNEIIPGETDNNLSPLTSGNYAVIITEDLCSDTSSCVAFTTVSIDEFSKNEFNIYPNPVVNELFIDYKNEQIFNVIVLDYSGRTVLEYKGNNNSINVAELTSGAYYIQLQTADGVAIRRFIKK
ncbi:MAG: T9SS type A sorting domain-containing protein [Crocinitomix sp.]|nr:T9SS type A sorting domain-containing protein [Crocinitomix sp.]